MSSPALDAFNAAVDATSLNAANKTAMKARGVTLYVGVTQEEAAHIIRHLDAAITSATGEDLTRLERIKAICEGLATDPSPHTSTAVAAILLNISGAQESWVEGLRSLYLAKNVTQAGIIFDDLLARFDIPAVRTRLTALKNLIASRGL